MVTKRTGLKVLALAAVLLLIAVACGGDGGKTVTGTVVEAVDRNIVDVDRV